MFKCDICNKEFISYRKLNGHKSVHKTIRYSVSRKKPFREHNCLYCNKLFCCQKKNRKYCSNKCQLEYQKKCIFLKIEQGEIFSVSAMKRYLIYKNSYRCEHCGNTGIYNNHKLSLQLDHIDGNSDNNRLSNLRLLCPNCHSQTPTWCIRNIKYTKRNNYLRNYKGD